MFFQDLHMMSIWNGFFSSLEIQVLRGQLPVLTWMKQELWYQV